MIRRPIASCAASDPPATSGRRDFVGKASNYRILDRAVINNCLLGFLMAAALGAPIAPAAAAEEVLVDVGRVDLNAAKKNDLRAQLVAPSSNARLRLEVGHHEQWPGISFAAPHGKWDLSRWGSVTVDVKNIGSAPAVVGCRLDSPGGDRARDFAQQTAELQPGESKTLRVRLSRRLPEVLQGKLFGMRGYPGGVVEQGEKKSKSMFDSAQVSEVRVFVAKPKANHQLEVGAIRATGQAAFPLPDDPQKMFPMIDRYGQYRHQEWPGKIQTDADLARNRKTEQADQAAHPGPAAWNRYGGWAKGPQLKATGFFRVENRDGRWWLVDPDGRLFWSHGVDCVRAETAATPISDREHWFENLPPRSGPFGAFYGKGSWAPHGYYTGKQYNTYCFSAANLLRKYGETWSEQFGPLVHARLRSWGLNTIANWSSPAVCQLHKTAYTATIHCSHKPLEGSVGYWGKFADVFDPSFRATLRKSLAKEKGHSAGDPWCLGYFVDNELGWGDETSLAVAALASPPAQAAKRAFVDDLRKKYGAIDGLNQAWGAKHASWDALVECRTPPDKKKAFDDLAAFTTRTAEEYFRGCRDAVKEVAPQQLYLGCRFAWGNERAVRAGAKFCDVVSFNLYRESVANFRLPEGVDRPVVIGEFHFGALDRGMLHTGLRPVENQEARAAAYRSYVTGALEHPQFVGTHWFQYSDQATTGRGDGENYQIGFVDVCDTPYPETIEASRAIGRNLYELRAGSGRIDGSSAK